jgi:hypothetical protein
MGVEGNDNPGMGELGAGFVDAGRGAWFEQVRGLFCAEFAED